MQSGKEGGTVFIGQAAYFYYSRGPLSSLISIQEDRMKKKIVLFGLCLLVLLPTVTLGGKNPSWNSYFDSGANDIASGSKTDASGNTYVYGEAGSKAVVVKFSASGQILWIAQFPDGEWTQSYFMDGALDSLGNLYLSALVSDSNVNRGVVLKYSPAGELIWSQVIPSSQTNAQARNLDVDANGIVHVLMSDTGYYSVICGYPGYFTYASGTSWTHQEYDASGMFLSSAYLGSYTERCGREDGDYWRDMVVSASGNELFLAGSVTSARDSQLSKFDRTGARLWDAVLNFTSQTGGFFERFVGLVADANGNLYAAGEYYGKRSYLGSIAAFDPSGNVLWQNSYESEDVRLNSIAVDSTGNVYAAGSSIGGDQSGALTLKYSGQGELLSQKLYTNSAPVNLKAAGVSIGIDGGTLVSGSSDTDIFLINYRD